MADSRSALHFVLFVRACVETHRLRKATKVKVVSLPVDTEGGKDLPEVAVNKREAETKNDANELAGQVLGQVPVVVPVSVAGQNGATTDVYMVTGQDGRPQLLAPVGSTLVVVPSVSELGQGAAVAEARVQPAEAGEGQLYELSGGNRRISEMDGTRR